VQLILNLSSKKVPKTPTHNFDKAVALAEKDEKEIWKLIEVKKRAAALLNNVAPVYAEKYQMSAAL
jgi:hypothetical protein